MSKGAVSKGAVSKGAVSSGSLDPWLLSKLCCPRTRASLRYDAAAQELISDAAGVAYPIRDGTPVMLIEHARPL